MISRRALAAAIGISLGVIAFTGCATTEPNQTGGTPPGPAESAAGSSVNDQDVMFAQMMVPHHQQAVEMAALTLAKDDIDPRVTKLAERIREAQGPEIELMTSWLESWGESTEASGHAGHGMEGMMSEDELRALEDATGDDAARLFLDQMIVHHLGAISMAEDEIQSGQNADATRLARQIVDDQRAEIDEMNSLLTSVGS